MGLCLSPSATPTQTSAARGQTTRATVTLFVRGAAAMGKPADTPCTTGLPLWPLFHPVAKANQIELVVVQTA